VSRGIGNCFINWRIPCAIFQEKADYVEAVCSFTFHSCRRNYLDYVRFCIRALVSFATAATGFWPLVSFATAATGFWPLVSFATAATGFWALISFAATAAVGVV
jgi:hypothetical protein